MGTAGRFPYRGWERKSNQKRAGNEERRNHSLITLITLSAMEVASESFQLTLPPLNVDTFILPVRNSGFDWKLGISFAEPEVQTILLCCDKIYPPDSSNWKIEARLWITVDGDEGGIPRTVSFQNNLKIHLVAKFLRGIAQEKIKCRITVLKITEKKPDIDFSRPNGRIFSDAIVRVGFEDFHVNKKFLSTYSGYFRKEFFEKKMEQVFIFGQIEAHEFHFLLQYLYHEKKFEDFHAYTMLKLGAFFEVDSLINECIDNFKIDKLDNWAVLDALVIADKNDFKDLLEAITNQWNTVNDIPKNLVRELKNFKPKNHIFLRKKIGLLKKAALQNPVVPTRNPHDSESEDDPENQDDLENHQQQRSMNPWDLPVHPWTILERVNPWNFPTTMPVPWGHHKGHSNSQNPPMAHQNRQDSQNLPVNHPNGQNPPMAQVNRQNLPVAHLNPQNPPMAHPIPQNPPLVHLNPRNRPMAHPNPQNPPMADQNLQFLLRARLAHPNGQNAPMAQPIVQNPPMAHQNPQNPPNPSMTHPIPQNPPTAHLNPQNLPMADQNLQFLLRARLIAQNLSMAHPNGQNLPMAQRSLQNPPVAHLSPQNAPMAHLNPQNPPLAHQNPQNPAMARPVPQNPPPAPSLPSSPNLKPQI